MKRKIYSFFAAGLMMLMLSASLHAQHWALPSSRWEYIVEQPGISGPAPPPSYCCELSVEKDTIVNNISCHKISGAASYFTYYTYDSLGIVYILLDDSFRATYDFNAQVGDTLQFYDDTTRYRTTIYNPERRIHVVVDSITMLHSHGQDLRFYHVRSWRYGRSPQSEYEFHHFNYAESIGLYSGDPWNGEATTFYPMFTTPTDYPWYYICDYADSSMTGGYWFYERDCQTVGIHDLSIEGTPLDCHPNPSTGTFTIDLPMIGTKSLHIYDMVGRTVWEGSTDEQSETVRLSHDGLYTVEVVAGERRYYSRILLQ